MNNNAMEVAGSDPDHVVARGANDATSSPPSDGVVDSDKVLTQLQSRIDQSQVQSATVEGQSEPVVSGDYCSFKVGQLDPSMGVKIKEILLRTKNCIVYIDEKFTLQWYWDFPLNAEFKLSMTR
jgi:hypothetical protein